MSDGANQPPGYYHGIGDPPGTQRYWNGEQWVGDPQPVPGLNPRPGPPAPGSGMAPGYSDTGIPGGMVLAGPGIRILARIIDWALFTVLTAIAFLSVGGLEWVGDVIELISESAETGEPLDTAELTDSTPSSVPATVVALALAVLQISLLALKGATVGKLLTGIRVICQDTGALPPGWGPALRRNLLVLLGLIPIVGGIIGLLGVLVGLASLVLLFADRQRRTVMDLIASTFVVKRPASTP